MLAIPSFSLLSIPVFNFSVITDKIANGVENSLKATIKTLTQDEEAFYNFAYKKEEMLSLDDMNQIEKLDDFYLWYIDTLADIVECDENRSSNLYKYFDELYTLVLKITTSISYIRSKNRQLTNAA